MLHMLSIDGSFVVDYWFWRDRSRLDLLGIRVTHELAPYELVQSRIVSNNIPLFASGQVCPAPEGHVPPTPTMLPDRVCIRLAFKNGKIPMTSAWNVPVKYFKLVLVSVKRIELKKGMFVLRIWYSCVILQVRVENEVSCLNDRSFYVLLEI